MVRLTIDLVIFALHEQSLCLLLSKRKQALFENKFALPATEIDIHADVSIEEAVKRKLKALTSLDTPYIEQVQTLGNKTRDPRGWSVTVVYYSLIPYSLLPEKFISNSQYQWMTVAQALKNPLAFDHDALIENCLQRFQNKSLYTSLPIFLLPLEFTLTELQKAYESILEFKMEKKSFRRRLLDAGFLEETGNIRRASHRPAQLYRLSEMQPYYFARIIEGARESKDI